MEFTYEDIESLRRALIDYYGSAMGYFPMAMVDMERIRTASPEEVIQEAQKVGLLR